MECVEQLVECWLLGGWSPGSSSDEGGGRKTTKICEGNLGMELFLQQRVRFDREVKGRHFGWGPTAGTKRTEVSLHRNTSHRNCKDKSERKVNLLHAL